MTYPRHRSCMANIHYHDQAIQILHPYQLIELAIPRPLGRKLVKSQQMGLKSAVNTPLLAAGCFIEWFLWVQLRGFGEDGQ